MLYWFSEVICFACTADANYEYSTTSKMYYIKKISLKFFIETPEVSVRNS